MKNTTLFRRSWLTLSVLVLLGFGSISLADEPGVSLVLPSNLSITYDPFSGLPSSEFLQAELNFEKRKQPGFSVRIRPINRGKFMAIGRQGRLPIQLEAMDAPRLRRVADEYQQNWPAKNSAKRTRELSYVVLLPESRIVGVGVYELPLEVDILDVATRQIILQVQVEPGLQMNIAGTRGNYEKGEKVAVIDFNELQTGETQQVFIQVRGNTRAEIKIESENGGVMRSREDQSLFVDYTVNLDGVKSTLATPLSIVRHVAPNKRGSAYKMKVRVGNVERAFAGSYQDIIHINVSPQ